MKITGYLLREAIKRWQLRRDMASGSFDSSLTTFSNESKKHPTDVIKDYLEAETSIALLQAEQDRYNLSIPVKVEVDGESVEMTLAQVIKCIGGVGRAEKMWRTAATPEKKDRYGYRDEARSKDQEYAQRTITMDQAAIQSNKLGRRASALRVAIATGNAQERDSDLEAALFE